jgi:hypothetical protein
MTKPRLLFDEHVPVALAGAILKLEPAIDVLFVGDPSTPPLGTPDPALLVAGETLGRILVTMDKRTMPGHVKDHYAAGGRIAGVILLRPGQPIASYAQDLLLIWHATTADEWLDNLDYIPF